MSPEKNPQEWIEAWNALAEPAKAFLFSMALGTMLVLRSEEKRPTLKKIIEIITGGTLAGVIGYIAHLAGFPPYVVWAANGVAIMLGVDKLRAIIDYGVDKFIYKKA